MKGKLFLLIVILFASFANVQADSRYSSRITHDGTIFFIMPHKISKTDGIKNFEYDITLLTWTDSVTVNFTFESSIMARPEDFEILSGDNVFKCTFYKPLFIDIKKGRYEIRLTSCFPLAVLESVIKSETPPLFSFTQDGVRRTASYTESAWRKDRKKLSEIIHVFLYSK